MAQAGAGTFLLRIEDLDQSRARPVWETGIRDDLHWLGLGWPEPVMRQSERLPAYRAALARLWSLGLLYPCTCRRADILAAAQAPQEGAPVTGPDGVVYPGTCRHRPRPARLPEAAVLRLDLGAALAGLGPLEFAETGAGPGGERGRITLDPGALRHGVGDVVLARRDMGSAYHLAVVVDDAAQGITHVTRGNDLFAATAVHVVLQHLLGLAVPVYHHHRLVRDDRGRRLAKRDDARALHLYRAEGLGPGDLRAMLGL